MTLTAPHPCPDTGIRKGQCWCADCDSQRGRIAELYAALRTGDCPHATREECEMYFDQIAAQVERLERDL